MSLEELKQWFTIKHMLDMLAEYRSFGVIPGIVLPMAEAFLPFLPLFVFVMANAAAFGLWKGFLISWIGTSVGSLLVFLLVRKIGRQRFFFFFTSPPDDSPHDALGGAPRFWSALFTALFSVYTIGSSQCCGGVIRHCDATIYVSGIVWKNGDGIYD